MTRQDWAWNKLSSNRELGTDVSFCITYLLIGAQTRWRRMVVDASLPGRSRAELPPESPMPSVTVRQRVQTGVAIRTVGRKDERFADCFDRPDRALHE